VLIVEKNFIDIKPTRMCSYTQEIHAGGSNLM